MLSDADIDGQGHGFPQISDSRTMKTDKMADLGSLHTFVYACPLLFLSGIDKVFVSLYLYL